MTLHELTNEKLDRKRAKAEIILNVSEYPKRIPFVLKMDPIFCENRPICSLTRRSSIGQHAIDHVRDRKVEDRVRELTLQELELISGGSNTEYGPEIVVVADGDGGDWGDWGDWGDSGDWYNPGDWGDGGGGDGGQGGPGPGAIDLAGRDCPVDQAAATSSLNSLYDNSPTARALIDAMGARGTDLNLIAANLAGGGPQARFDAGSNQILWDPFVYVVGTNSNGSTYTLAPIMVLAHELVHAGHADDPAYQGQDSEALVMQIANQIAMEMNAATGSSYETSRDSHFHTARHWTSSSTSTNFSIARPGCN